jgi:hypothetical protein
MSKSLTEIRSLARSYTEMAIQTLAGIAQNGEQEASRVRAAEALLDRGWGKPTQPISGDEENPLRVAIGRIELVALKPNDNGTDSASS